MCKARFVKEIPVFIPDKRRIGKQLEDFMHNQLIRCHVRIFYFLSTCKMQQRWETVKKDYRLLTIDALVVMM